MTEPVGPGCYPAVRIRYGVMTIDLLVNIDYMHREDVSRGSVWISLACRQCYRQLSMTAMWCLPSEGTRPRPIPAIPSRWRYSPGHRPVGVSTGMGRHFLCMTGRLPIGETLQIASTVIGSPGKAPLIALRSPHSRHFITASGEYRRNSPPQRVGKTHHIPTSITSKPPHVT